MGRPDWDALQSTIRDQFPESDLTTLDEASIAALRAEHPDVPLHYTDFLSQVGWGSLGGVFMIYSGPCKPSSFFGTNPPAALDGILFVGDDNAGWMIGFDTRNGWRFVGVDSCSRESSPEMADTLAAFIAERLADATI